MAEPTRSDDIMLGLDDAAMCELLGPQDANLRALQQRTGASITVRGERVRVSGTQDELALARAVLDEMVSALKSGEPPTVSFVDRAVDTVRAGNLAPSSLASDVLLTYRGRSIRPKTSGQKRYVDAIRSNTITFCIGPAGTGKTYLAVALALSALQRKEVGRIVLTRPVVEAGESLGYLPGTLSEKVDPFIRPLTDALFDMCDSARISELAKHNVIEIAPLAYMRGRTLSDSFIILDEGQNTTPEQMKMFLTRLGFGSRMVITGDITQIDLPRGSSGLKNIRSLIEGIEDVAYLELSPKDVVRHSLVARITEAYERAGRHNPDPKDGGGAQGLDGGKR